MDISVLMSVYKSEKADHLNDAIKSVWDDQSLRPDEIVLVKDGPLYADLDNVIDEWKNRLGDAFQVITNEENIGLTKSLNKGLRIIRGKYIARMDSDDIASPHRFKSQKEFLDQHSDVSILGGAVQEFDEENSNIRVRHYPRNNQEVLKYIYKATPLSHPTVMMRKSIFENGLSYNERYKTSQDIALWYDALIAGHKIANLDTVLLFSRRDKDIFKRRSKAKAKNEFIIFINGIRHLYGLSTWRYIYPIARCIFRMLPLPLIAHIYDSEIRTKVVEHI